jgi:hypothetical protein
MEHIFYGFQTMGLALKPRKYLILWFSNHGTLILWFSNHGFGIRTLKNNYSMVFKPWVWL